MPVLMRYKTDCEVAAIATACGVDWVTACAALHWRKMPGVLEVIFANPWNLYKALITLGFWKKNVTLQMLLNGKCEPGKTIVLIKKSFTQQHWVVWAGLDGFGNHLFFWGDSEKPVKKTPVEVQELFLKSKPNCAFQVYKANFWQLMFAKVQAFFN